ATTNAASATVHGLDLQFRAPIGSWSNISGGAQVLDAHFNDFRSATCTDYSQATVAFFPPIACDASGNRLPFAPKFRLNLSATHRMSFDNAGSFLFTSNIAYSSGYFSEPDNVVKQDAYLLLDGSIEWARPPWPTLRVWAVNLTNSHYYDSLTVFPTAAVLFRPGAPRRIGASLIHAF